MKLAKQSGKGREEEKIGGRGPRTASCNNKVVVLS